MCIPGGGWSLLEKDMTRNWAPGVRRVLVSSDADDAAGVSSVGDGKGGDAGEQEALDSYPRR